MSQQTKTGRVKEENKAEDRLLEKKEKVLKKQKKLSSTSLLIIFIISTMVIGGIILNQTGSSQEKQIKPPKQVPRVKVSEPVDYSQARVDMKKVTNVTKEGRFLTLPVATVVKNKLVRFVFRSPKINVKQRNFAGKPELPLIAMIVPSGKLMVGISYCEPCRSTTFHTEQDLSLTCNICGTKWDAETFIAWSGACMPYPPDEVKVTVKNQKIYIPVDYLEKWKPRVQT